MKIWFQNRRTKWKKQENISRSEVAEHKLCAEKNTIKTKNKKNGEPALEVKFDQRVGSEENNALEHFNDLPSNTTFEFFARTKFKKHINDALSFCSISSASADFKSVSRHVNCDGGNNSAKCCFIKVENSENSARIDQDEPGSTFCDTESGNTTPTQQDSPERAMATNIQDMSVDRLKEDCGRSPCNSHDIHRAIPKFSLNSCNPNPECLLLRNIYRLKRGETNLTDSATSPSPPSILDSSDLSDICTPLDSNQRHYIKDAPVDLDVNGEEEDSLVSVESNLTHS